MVAYVEAVAGFALLLIGGEILVRGAVALARGLGLSPLFVGLTVVAFGTSAPELVVSLFAALEGKPGIAVGNVVGSNIANILLILGITALVYPIACRGRALFRNSMVMLGATVMFVVIAHAGTLTRLHGILMLVALVLYVVFSYRTDRKDQEATREIVREVTQLEGAGDAGWRIAAKLVGGIVGVAVGSEFLVDGGSAIARDLGVSEAVIGLTMIAVGTSLPELVTGIIAACHKHSDLALGNVIGSNIFNILSVMGLVVVVVPVDIPTQIIAVDLWVMLGVSVAFVALAFALGQVGRWLGFFMLLGYALYVATQFGGVHELAFIGAG